MELKCPNPSSPYLVRLWAGHFISTGHWSLKTTSGGEISIPCTGATLPNSHASPITPACWETDLGRGLLCAGLPLSGPGRHWPTEGPPIGYDMVGPRGSFFGVSSHPDALPLHASPYNKLPFLKMASGCPVLATKILTYLHIQMREHRLWEVSAQSHTSRKWQS